MVKAKGAKANLHGASLILFFASKLRGCLERAQ